MTRANVRVRPATADDVPAIAAMMQTVDLSSGAFSGKPLGDPSAEHIEARLREIMRQSDRVVLIAAEDNGTVSGMLAGRHDDIGAIDLTPVLHITHLMVAPTHRRKGLGRALLAAAVHVADESGTEHVLATAAAGSREGNRYLARIGFAPLVVHRIAPTNVLRRTLGMTDVASRMALLRRARLTRAQRAGFAPRPASRGV